MVTQQLLSIAENNRNQTDCPREQLGRSSYQVGSLYKDPKPSMVALVPDIILTTVSTTIFLKGAKAWGLKHHAAARASWK